MNDFTKEELHFIWQRLAIWDYSNFQDMLDLPNKVYTMIDNYHEHEWYTNIALGCKSCLCGARR